MKCKVLNCEAQTSHNISALRLLTFQLIFQKYGKNTRRKAKIHGFYHFIYTKLTPFISRKICAKLLLQRLFPHASQDAAFAPENTANNYCLSVRNTQYQ